MESSHTLHVAPHEIFAADRPGPSEMIQVLMLVDVAESSLSEKTRPADVVGGARDVPEASHLQRVHDRVVGVRAVGDLETRRAVGFELVLRELHNAREVTRQVTL